MTKYSPSQLQEHAAQAAALLKQLANPVRLLILCQLLSGDKSVGEMTSRIDISQSALSQHLAKMRGAGLIEPQKKGQMVYYRIADMRVHALLSTLYLIFCKD